MMAWSRSARARSGSGISAILASTSPSPSALPARGPRRASAFSSLVRSFIAPRSSSVRPVNVLSVALVVLADCWVSFSVGFLSAMAEYLLASNASQPLLATIAAVTASIKTSPATVASDRDRTEHRQQHGRPDQRASNEVAGGVAEQHLGSRAAGEAAHGLDHVRDRLVRGDGPKAARHRRDRDVRAGDERERHQDEGQALGRSRVARIQPGGDEHPLEGEAEHDDQGEGEQAAADPAVEPKADQEAGDRHDQQPHVWVAVSATARPASTALRGIGRERSRSNRPWARASVMLRAAPMPCQMSMVVRMRGTTKPT